ASAPPLALSLDRLPSLRGSRSHQAAALRTRRTHPPQPSLLALLLWAGIILGFFTISSRQEYYHLPALPALALLVGGLLAAADRAVAPSPIPFADNAPQRVLRGSLFFLV